MESKINQLKALAESRGVKFAVIAAIADTIEDPENSPRAIIIAEEGDGYTVCDNRDLEAYTEHFATLAQAVEYATGETLTSDVFWLNIENRIIVRIEEGTGDNLEPEDVEAGYVDYLNYETYKAIPNADYEDLHEQSDYEDGGMLLLTKPYRSYEEHELAKMLLASELPTEAESDWKWQVKTPTIEEEEVEAGHYNDGLIDIRFIDEFLYWVLTNCDGETVTINMDDNFFSAIDIIGNYIKLWKKSWNMDDKLDKYVQGVKNWLIATGCEPEELKD